jgi:hypothetical protein
MNRAAGRLAYAVVFTVVFAVVPGLASADQVVAGTAGSVGFPSGAKPARRFRCGAN